MTETLSGITLNYRRPTITPSCCSLEPGQPIYDSTYQVPCYTVPATSHRTVTTLVNSSQVNEAAPRFVLDNPSGTDGVNIRVALYDPTLIGLAAGTVPGTDGTWPSGIQEWECTALVGEYFVPVLTAGTTLDIDGRRRRVLTHPTGVPANASTGDRYFYGGPTMPWMFDPIPPGKTWTAVVFADPTIDPAVTCQIQTSALHLTAGAAQ